MTMTKGSKLIERISREEKEQNGMEWNRLLLHYQKDVMNASTPKHIRKNKKKRPVRSTIHAHVDGMIA